MRTLEGGHAVCPICNLTLHNFTLLTAAFIFWSHPLPAQSQLSCRFASAISLHGPSTVVQCLHHLHDLRIELDLICLFLPNHDGVLQMKVQDSDHLILCRLEECVLDIVEHHINRLAGGTKDLAQTTWPRKILSLATGIATSATTPQAFTRSGQS